MDLHDTIDGMVQVIELDVIGMFNDKFGKSPKQPPLDTFKASVMAEIARRIRARAVAIEEGQS